MEKIFCRPITAFNFADLPFRLRITLALSVTALGIAAIACLPPIPQDPGYHAFADGRSLRLIPNAGNVFSNALFILAGVTGLLRLKSVKSIFLWRFFYCSIGLVGIGSAYYHLAPANLLLVSDRIPMSIGFASVIAVMIAERINEKAGGLLLFPLVFVGIRSVLYWYAGETSGVGDLRPYIAVQVLPILLIPMLILLFPERKSPADKSLLILLAGYILAKVCEVEDGAIYILTDHLISGHTLKHILAGASLFAFRPVPETKTAR